MKNHLTLSVLFFLLFQSFTFSQVKIIRYCEVISNLKYGSTQEIKDHDDKIYTKVFLGQNEDYFNLKDSSIVLKLKKVNDLTTTSDLLNYMNSIGWNLVDLSTISWRKYYYFKKEFEVGDFK